MGDPYGAVGRIDALAAVTGSVENVDPKICRIDGQFHVIGFGKNSDCNGGRMDPSAAFCRGNAFYTMNAALEFHTGESIRT